MLGHSRVLFVKSFLGGQPGVQHGLDLRGKLGYAVAAGAGTGLSLLRAEQAATGHGAGQFLTIYVYDVDIEQPSERMGLLEFGHVLLHFRGIAGCGQQQLVARIGMLLIRGQYGDAVSGQDLLYVRHGGIE